MVHRIEMPVKGLHTQASFNVPKGDGLICTTGAEYVGVGLEGSMVYGIDMPTESMPTLPCIQIQQLGVVIHRSSCCKIASVVHCHAPDRLDVILEGMSASGIYEVPNLDS